MSLYIACTLRIRASYSSRSVSVSSLDFATKAYFILLTLAIPSA
jgi:hypothetical protein